ncbi:kinase-like protein [Serendipita vermifera]|nr:kinase-like protein [Serendipita vermifera]
MEDYSSTSGEQPADPCLVEAPLSSSSLPPLSAEETLLHVSKNTNNVVRGPNSQYPLDICPYIDGFIKFSKSIPDYLFGGRVAPFESPSSNNDENDDSRRFENATASEISRHGAPGRMDEGSRPSSFCLASLLTATHDQPSIVPNLTGQVTRGTDLVFAGNYSTVVMGEWNGIRVAIKDIRGQGTLVATQRRIRREREVWGCLKHKNILPLYGYVDDFGLYGALISPWYKNGQSGDYIRKSSLRATQRFELASTLHMIWRDVIVGLVYLHSLDPVLIHGDLKPMNVLVDDDGHARICDFGLVRILFDETLGLNTTTTHTGTARYLAYELAVDDKPTPTTASDVYAVGCIGLEFIFLTTPYTDCKRHAQLFVSLAQKIPPATKIPILGEPPGPMLELWDVLNACWKVIPQSRPSVCELERGLSLLDQGLAFVKAQQVPLLVNWMDDR